MPARQIAFFEFASNGAAVWDVASLTEFAELSFPFDVLSGAKNLVRADAYLEWIRWYAEGLIDPAHFSGTKTSYADIFEVAFEVVVSHFGGAEKGEQKALSSAMARYIHGRVGLMAISKASRNRPKVSREMRQQLVDLAGDPPRCWITGKVFGRSQLDQFLGVGESLHSLPQPSELPLYVDVYRPIGLVGRDLNIEIDHVVPFSHGGNDQDNLRLACGWANAHKRHYVNLYDVAGAVRSSRGQLSSGIVPPTLPQSFWVIRLLATRRKCEHPGGCAADTSNAELTVALIDARGAPTPTNLRVVCYEHDPMAKTRLVPRVTAAKAWGTNPSATPDE